MKKVLFAAALLAAASSVQAQVTVGTPIVINVGSVAVAPQGVAVANNAVYAVGFTNRSIIKVSDVTSTPTLTTIGNLNAVTTWAAASRGPQDLDILGNTLYIFSDNGTTGILNTVDLTNDTLGGTTVTATPNSRIAGGFVASASLIYGAKPDSSTIRTLDGTLTQTGLSAAGGAGFVTPFRDIEVIGTDLFYVSANTGGAAPHTIGKFAPVTGSSDIATATFTGFYTPALADAAGSRNHVGLATYTQGATTYLVFPQSNTTTPSGSVAFIDSTNASNVTTVGSAALSGRQLTGVAVGTINGVTYLVVASQNGGTNPNELYLFPITSAASSVESWNQY
ncbi:MAG: hypothetical protein SFY68_02525 [Candidatus Sumerlaeia bacterium]|nr:hypothetical protein [Candidatus Sumerlaeia bacterium]